MDYIELADAIERRGLRLIIVRGLPSPWSQAAKTVFELKKIPFAMAPQEPGAENEELRAWSGQSSAPVVAYDGEPPRHHWLDILFLAERIAPEPALIPADPVLRAQMIGWSHEICGELGLGWCRRLNMFQPAIDSGSPPDHITLLAKRYRYSPAEAEAAPQRMAATLWALSEQLREQRARESRFLIGNSVTALDIYWAAFANLFDPLPDALCPIPTSWRPAFVARNAIVVEALDKSLLEHRDFICEEYFRLPMEF